MFGNFDSPMALRNQGQTLEACGPLQWDEGEAANVIIRVSFKQRKDPAVMGNSGAATFDNADDEWMFPMAAMTLKPGLARAHGEAINNADGKQLDAWDQTVRLKPHP